MTFAEYAKTKGKLVLFLILAATTMTYFTCDSCLKAVDRYILVTIYIASMWITMWLGNEYITHWLDDRISWTREPVKRLAIGTVAVVVYSVVAAYLLDRFYETVFGFSVGVTSQLTLTVTIAIVITLIMTSRSFLFNWRQSAIDAEKLQKESIAARYESLKNQVNPHFLFNSFNALSNLVHDDPDKAVKFIKQLSEVYRYVLDTREREVVTLEEELRFLQSYTYLQKIRFEDKLSIDIQLENIHGQVAPLALQILVENAIKHNIVSEDDPLQVKIYSDNGFIVVQNNLQKKGTVNEPSAGVGLENICRRYEFLSSKKVEIHQSTDHFLVKLPLLST
jgi:sensor histidine kinase YesM